MKNQILIFCFYIRSTFSLNPTSEFFCASQRNLRELRFDTVQINHFFKQSFFVNKRSNSVSQNPLTKFHKYLKNNRIGFGLYIA